MARILVADDEKDLRDALRRVFERDGHEVITAENGKETVELARTTHPDLAVLDNRMPGMSGIDALARIRETDPSLVAVVFTAFDDAADVRRAVIELGAYGYLTKDSGVEAIRATIQQALRSRGLWSQRPAEAPAAPTDEQLDYAHMVGRSPAMRDVYALVERIGHSDVTVLIQGESGTGKELVARALHDRGLRVGRPYVTVDCGTLPDTLTESEIFGHEAGAFTDARRSKAGKIEMADSGTLFLDEIGNLSPSAQAKLLRVLEDRRVTRLGGTQVKEIDVRIIAATNLDLEVASRERTFREDLYYRLNVFKILLPPLRDRREDIPVLLEHFMKRFAAEQKTSFPGGVTPDAMELLVAHPWPGNVRELRNAVERAVLLATDAITPADLPEAISQQTDAPRPAARPAAAPRAAPPAGSEETIVPVSLPPFDLDGVPLKDAKRLAGDAVERAYIVAALRRTRWNKAKAAKLLGLNYKTLREKVRDLDLERLKFE